MKQGPPDSLSSALLPGCLHCWREAGPKLKEDRGRAGRSPRIPFFQHPHILLHRWRPMSSVPWDCCYQLKIPNPFPGMAGVAGGAENRFSVSFSPRFLHLHPG